MMDGLQQPYLKCVFPAASYIVNFLKISSYETPVYRKVDSRRGQRASLLWATELESSLFTAYRTARRTAAGLCTGSGSACGIGTTRRDDWSRWGQPHEGELLRRLDASAVMACLVPLRLSHPVRRLRRKGRNCAQRGSAREPARCQGSHPAPWVTVRRRRAARAGLDGARAAAAAGGRGRGAGDGGGRGGGVWAGPAALQRGDRGDVDRDQYQVRGGPDCLRGRGRGMARIGGGTGQRDCPTGEGGWNGREREEGKA